MSVYLLNSPQVIQNCIAEILKSSGKEVIVRERVKKKTRQQEKYFHRLIDIIIEFTGDDKTEMKRQITWSCDITESFQDKDGNNILVPKQTSDMNVEEYNKIIPAAQMICMNLGLEYPDPEQYRSIYG